MNIFKKALEKLTSFFTTKVPGARQAAKNIKSLADAGITKNNALKRLNANLKVLSKKSGYSEDQLKGGKISGKYRKELSQIFKSFNAEKGSSAENIKEEYENLYGKGGEQNTKKQSSALDAWDNYKSARFVTDMLGSPTEKAIWDHFKNNKEKINSDRLKRALLNAAQYSYEYELYQNPEFNEMDRVDLVWEMYNVLSVREGDEEYRPWEG